MVSSPHAAEAARVIDHEFKSHPDVFWPAARGEKNFEFRRDDRGGYKVGQTVRLRCYDPDHGYYGASPLDRRITNILRGGEFELPAGYSILSLAPLDPAPRAPAAPGLEALSDAENAAKQSSDAADTKGSGVDCIQAFILRVKARDTRKAFERAAVNYARTLLDAAPAAPPAEGGELRDDVLFAFHRYVENPTPFKVTWWTRHFPQFAKDIREHAVEVIDMNFMASRTAPAGSSVVTASAEPKSFIVRDCACCSDQPTVPPDCPACHGVGGFTRYHISNATPLATTPTPLAQAETAGRAEAIRSADLSWFAAAAAQINDSPALMSVYAAPEWDELSDDGQCWVAALVRETLAMGVETPQFAPARPPAPAVDVPAERERIAWHDRTEEPAIGQKIVGLWDDGSGARLLYRHDGGYIDQDGEDCTEMGASVSRWAYLPGNHAFFCEHYAGDDDQPMELPVTDAVIASRTTDPGGAGDGWQPIETAEGNDLLWLFEPHSRGGFMFAGCRRTDGVGWYNNLDGRLQRPTHWQSLPEPPATRPASPSTPEGGR